MKKFLTVSMFCLGIAAVATTQANSKVNVSGYRLDTGTGKCTFEVTNACSPVHDTGCEDPNDFAQLYEFNDGPCVQPLAKP